MLKFLSTAIVLGIILLGNLTLASHLDEEFIGIYDLDTSGPGTETCPRHITIPPLKTLLKEGISGTTPLFVYNQKIILFKKDQNFSQKAPERVNFLFELKFSKPTEEDDVARPKITFTEISEGEIPGCNAVFIKRPVPKKLDTKSHRRKK